MRVLIDAHMVGGNETGNETYIANLASHLAQLPGIECAASVVADVDLPVYFRDSSINHFPLYPTGDWLRLLYTLPKMGYRWSADILHVTYVAPLHVPCSLVVSVHDVSFKQYPEFFSTKERLLFATLLPMSLRRASAVITLSSHAKQEILTFYPFLEGKVYDIPLAASSLFRQIDEVESLNKIRLRYRLDHDFILAVGNIQPRKNLNRLIQAFKSVRQKINKVKLVIVGQAQWQASAIYAAIRQNGLEKDVIFTGYVTDEDLVLLYNSARIFIYPSLYEGFGLPILEAMSCGTPVITSNLSSMPEVAGDAALLVDPYSDEHMVDAILQIWEDESLALSLSERGLYRSQNFSWHETALKTLMVYKKILDYR
jgi:glycosyltransferase involved in cell wall biosynthesis